MTLTSTITTADAWNAATDPVAMMRTLESFQTSYPQRTFRLYCCTCGRRIWHLLSEQQRSAIEVGEAYDGPEKEVTDTLVADFKYLQPGAPKSPLEAARLSIVGEADPVQAVAYYAVGDWAMGSAIEVTRLMHESSEVQDAELVSIIRNAFGNPFDQA